MDSGRGTAEAGLPQQPEPAHQLYEPQQPVYIYPHCPPPHQHPGLAPSALPTHYPAPAAVPLAYTSDSCVGPDGVQRHAYVYSAQSVSFYQDPSHASHGSWVAEQNPAGQFGAGQFSYDQTGRVTNRTEQLGIANSFWNNTMARPYVNNSLKRKKKTKVVQSAWCDVCNIECSSKEVLDQHKQGKRHKKNLEKLQQPRNDPTAPVPSAIVPDNPTHRVDTFTTGTKRKRSLASVAGEDLETKKQKLMAGGAAPEAVRMCSICNVVCNSDLVFKYHLAGQKHVTQLKKQMALAVTVSGPAVIAA